MKKIEEHKNDLKSLFKVLKIDIPCTKGVVLKKLLTKKKKKENFNQKRKKIAAIENFLRWEVPFRTVFSELNVVKYGQSNKTNFSYIIKTKENKK